VNGRQLWIAQRITAMILALCVLVHLVTIVYAVRSGLSASGILARTRGSAVIGSFYALFVVAAAIHGGIGLRTIAMEWLRLGRGSTWLAAVAALALVVLGLRAVAAVVAA